MKTGRRRLKPADGAAASGPQREMGGAAAELDRRHVWHPFTQMRDWLKSEPVVIVAGQGTRLWDAQGREYLDANASIWTNLHGHRHPVLDCALRRQLGRIAHSSALGLANEPAAHLAARLIDVANRGPIRGASAGGARLAKVFYSDDGATAVEVALKLAYEYARRVAGKPRPRFLSLRGGYHGDTVGAVSLGHIDLFHHSYAGLLFRSDAVMAPYCYRCPFNQAAPERRDARETRRCRWECVDAVQRRLEQRRRHGAGHAALVVEPRIQGAAGMIAQPAGWFGRVAELARGHGVQLIADEVLTGFGRTGVGGDGEDGARGGWLLASQHEGVRPDYLCLAKGLTGGYLPMAATLTTEAVFAAFLGEYAEFRTFFHGHSYTGNQLGAAAATASLDLLDTARSFQRRRAIEAALARLLEPLWNRPVVGDIRRVGTLVGIELVRNWRTRQPFDLVEQAGIRVCAAMAQRGVLTRPIGSVVVLVPPYCTTPTELERMVSALDEAIAETFPDCPPH
jgi:adenosylmethionine-8-amino-7-oxononanoate aminotransferase